MLGFFTSHFQRLPFRCFSARQSFLDQVAELRKQHPGRPIALAVSQAGFLDYLVLRFFINERFGREFSLKCATRLPSIYIDGAGNHLRRIASFFGIGKKPDSRIIRCSRELSRGNTILLVYGYWEKRKAFAIPPGEADLSFLKKDHPNLLVAPVSFIWRKTTRNEVATWSKHPIFTFLFGPIVWTWDLILGDAYQPTEARKLLILLRRYSYSSLRLLEPVDVQNLDPLTARREILIKINQAKRTMLGPVFKSPQLLGESLIRDKGFLRFVSQVAKQRNVDVYQVLNESNSIFHEIASKLSFPWVEFIGKFLNFVFDAIYQGIDLDKEQVKQLHEESKLGPLLFIPNHSSYIDFLVLSYVLYHEDVTPPHIAAGENLSFFPMGYIFRRGGAFFIRRSFRGDDLYREIMKRYVALLLNNRFNLEFFIEGTRSRNGKLVPPKYGMLNMIFEGHKQGLIKENVRIIPVSITYDRLTEERAYAKELAGGDKTKENVVNIIKSGKVLFNRYGKVYIRFGQGISLDNWLPKQTDIDRHSSVYKLTFEICYQINQHRPISGIGVVASLALLASDDFYRADLDQLIAVFEKACSQLDVLMHDDLKINFSKTSRRAVARLVDDQTMEKINFVDGLKLKIPDKFRIQALFAKNSSIHAFLIPAVHGLVGDNEKEAILLRNYLQFEFFFPKKDVYLSLVKKSEAGIPYDIFSSFLGDVLETQFQGISALITLRDSYFDSKEWVNQIMKYGRNSIEENRVRWPESINTQAIASFVLMAKKNGWLKDSPHDQKLFTVARIEEMKEALTQIEIFFGRMPSWEEIKTKYCKVQNKALPQPEMS